MKKKDEVLRDSPEQLSLLTLNALNYRMRFKGVVALKYTYVSAGVRKRQVRSLGQEDPLEEGMAVHSILLLRESRGQRKVADYAHRVAETWTRLKRLSAHTHTHTHTHTIK